MSSSTAAHPLSQTPPRAIRTLYMRALIRSSDNYPFCIGFAQGSRYGSGRIPSTRGRMNSIRIIVTEMVNALMMFM